MRCLLRVRSPEGDLLCLPCQQFGIFAALLPQRCSIPKKGACCREEPTEGPGIFPVRPQQSAVRAEAIRGRERCPRHSGNLVWNALDDARLRHSAHHFQPEHSGQRSHTDFSANFGWRQGKLGGFHPVGWISTWLHSVVYIRWWEPLWFQRWFPQLFQLWFRGR